MRSQRVVSNVIKIMFGRAAVGGLGGGVALTHLVSKTSSSMRRKISMRKV
jgi:hypothetical protein